MVVSKPRGHCLNAERAVVVVLNGNKNCHGNDVAFCPDSKWNIQISKNAYLLASVALNRFIARKVRIKGVFSISY